MKLFKTRFVKDFLRILSSTGRSAFKQSLFFLRTTYYKSVVLFIFPVLVFGTRDQSFTEFTITLPITIEELGKSFESPKSSKYSKVMTEQAERGSCESPRLSELFSESESDSEEDFDWSSIFSRPTKPLNIYGVNMHLVNKNTDKKEQKVKVFLEKDQGPKDTKYKNGAHRYYCQRFAQAFNNQSEATKKIIEKYFDETDVASENSRALFTNKCQEIFIIHNAQYRKDNFEKRKERQRQKSFMEEFKKYTENNFEKLKKSFKKLKGEQNIREVVDLQMFDLIFKKPKLN